MTKKKFRLTTCNICGAQAPANFMVRAKKAIKATSRNTVGGKEVIGSILGFETSQKALKNAQLSIDDIDIYEVNEAFAPVPLAWAKELKADKDKLNVNGGAMALGHPLGATGAKLMTTMLHELERRKARYALQAICEGGGTANATIIKRLD